MQDSHIPIYSQSSFVPEKGLNALLWDKNGNRCIDFFGGIAVTALGHCNPTLTQIAQEQLNLIWHTSNLFANDSRIELANKLCETSFAERVLFSNSGTEAVEAAIKLAINYCQSILGKPSKKKVIVFDGAFHGRTFLSLAATDNYGKNRDFDIGINIIERVGFEQLEQLEQVISDDTAAVLIEPIQGESGVRAFSKQFLQAVRQLCNQFNACLIFDEIQCGMGRTGSLFAHQKFDIIPDIMTLAKALGNGLPIGAILCNRAIGDAMIVGSHGSTFAGNPMICAVANEVVKTISDSKFLAQVNQKSKILENSLHHINVKNQYFEQIRCYGMIVGLDLASKLLPYRAQIVQKCMEKGLLIIVAGSNTLRICPPLTIEVKLINEGVGILQEVLDEVLPD